MLVGRKKEIKELETLYQSNKSEFVAVYGRRRVGKTTLVDEVFKDVYAFKHTGKSKEELVKEKRKTSNQLSTFYLSLKLFGLEIKQKPKNWDEAFYLLIKLLESKPKDKKQVVFIDEVPWLDTPKSNFLKSLEWFWNFYGSSNSHLLLIISGSSTSWVMNKIFKNHGGLYGRVTYKMNLRPLNLKECEELLLSNKVHYSRYDIVQSYMVFGGVPYYLHMIKRGKSLANNINEIFFDKNAQLEDEFDELFSSSFEHHELCKKIIRLLNKKSSGYSTEEILTLLNITDSKSFRDSLKALERGSFIIKYVPFKGDGREKIYKLTDPFVLFYLRFIENRKTLDTSLWNDFNASSSANVWRGLSFENICFEHLDQIKKALGVFQIKTLQPSYRETTNVEEGFQIDLLIERTDKIINLCEMKFLKNEFYVDKEYMEKLKKRENNLYKLVSNKSIIQHVLITTYGLEENDYSYIFDNVITIDDLFN